MNGTPAACLASTDPAPAHALSMLAATPASYVKTPTCEQAERWPGGGREVAERWPGGGREVAGKCWPGERVDLRRELVDDVARGQRLGEDQVSRAEPSPGALDARTNHAARSHRACLLVKVELADHVHAQVRHLWDVISTRPRRGTSRSTSMPELGRT